jgi:bla regulator protein BlaR1
MATELFNHLWQSTVFAGVAGLLTLALRRNRARVRYAVWLAASLKFLIPFALLTWIGTQIEWRTPIPASPANLAIVIDQVTEPFSSMIPAAITPAHPQSVNWVPATLVTIWTCGFLAIAIVWRIRLRRIQKLVSAASPLDIGLSISTRMSTRSTAALLEPGVFGMHPVLLLPEGIVDRLTRAQLQSVIAHELCHVRHRDNLIAAVQMFIETIFWFHPLVWWIGKQMIAERERACDEAVLTLGNDSHVYAEAILNVCKLYVESPVACVSGVTGAGLKQRIQAIVANRPAAALNRAKKILLAAAAVIALATPIALGIMNAPAMRAQSPDTSLKFEVASVKPYAGPGFPNSFAMQRSGGRIRWTNTLMGLVMYAYRIEAFQETGMAHVPYSFWVIDAKTSPDATDDQIRLMVQSLLAERFKFRAHREKRQLAGYALMAAKGGVKIKAIAPDAAPEPLPEWFARGGDALSKNIEGKILATMEGKGITAITGRRITIAQLVQTLEDRLRAPVLDQTGLTGQYYFAFKSVSVDAPPNADSDASILAPTLFDALKESLGLRLEKQTVPVDMLVVDHVEKTPTDNFDPPVQAPQTPPLRFDVASVKPNNSGRAGTDGFEVAHGSLTVKNVSLKMLLESAYQIEGARISGGPPWMNSDRFDVIAKGPSTATKAEVWSMLRTLLAERFGVQLNRETKELPIYSMKLAKGGPKMKKRDGVDCGGASESAPPLGQPFVAPCGGVVRVWGPQGGVMVGQRVSISGIAQALSSIVDRPVVDHSGLSGAYDVELRWTPDGYQFAGGPGEEKPRSESAEPGPSLYASVQEQLGLKLVAAKGLVEILVIDRAQRPTGN